jgi:hypothetical protein
VNLALANPAQIRTEIGAWQVLESNCKLATAAES